MAAGTFTPSVIQDAQIRLSEIFATPNSAQTETLVGEAAAARAMLARQTARTDQRLVGQNIVGVKAWYFRPGAADIATGSWPADNSCDVPAASQGETISVDYDTAILAYANAEVRTNRSNNLITEVEEMAQQMAHIHARLRRYLNRDVIITALPANAQANMDTFINSAWDATTNTPRIVVPESDFVYENLNEFRILAKNNNFSDNHFFLAGRLFNDNRWMAGLNANNETLRQQANAWREREIIFDERDLDVEVGYKSAFAIDQNSYAFWNTYRNGSTPTRIEGDKEIWTWAMPDNTGLVWNNNGVLTPVVYEMEMQVVCTGRDAQDFHQAKKTISGRLMGGFQFAPEGPGGETGVLHFAIS